MQFIKAPQIDGLFYLHIIIFVHNLLTSNLRVYKMFRLKNKKQRENSLIVMRAISRIKKYEMNENSSYGLYNPLLKEQTN